MTDFTEEKIKQSIKDRKSLHLRFVDNVKTYNSFLDVEEITFKDGALVKKQRINGIGNFHCNEM